MNPLDDIIAAISTPIGEGGIAVVRVSGPGAIELADRLFRGRVSLLDIPTHSAHFGLLVDDEGVSIDEVIATVFRAPQSYTAEDLVEISCHGGVYVTRKVLEIILKTGARLAEPGEFTRRAFCNGRLDLSQAEAVSDLIRAGSENARRAAMSQLHGALSQEIRLARDKLMNVCSTLELELDFCEEGIEFANRSQMATAIREVIGEVDRLVNSHRLGRMYREGVKVVIAGPPNAGKSSILNSLLNQDRAIVTDIPGTTRDVIVENLTMEGMLFTIMDTAGLREDADGVEREGIVRTERALHESDITLLVLDSTQIGQVSSDPIGQFPARLRAGQAIIVALNKIDLVDDTKVSPPCSLLSHPFICVSAKTGRGLDELRRLLADTALEVGGNLPDKSAMVTSTRHLNCLQNARSSLMEGLVDLESGKSNELIAVNLRSAMERLGEIVGVVTSEDILNNIFAKFCIGK